MGICDAWDARRAEAARVLGGTVAQVKDYRELLDRTDIDAVIISTWDNTHASICIDACEAGKDIYLEKPIASNFEDAKRVIAAVERTNRIVQVGTQQRSMQHFIEAKERFIDSGLIGDVHSVGSIWNSSPAFLNAVPTEYIAKPKGLDWEACLGDLPKIPWNCKRYFNRYAYSDLCTGGQSGSLFVHMVDVVNWFLGLKRPKSVVSLGGIYRYDDGRDTPDNIKLIVEYSERVLLAFEASLTTWANKKMENLSETERGVQLEEWKSSISQEMRSSLFESNIVFHGTEGRLTIWRHGYQFMKNDEEPITAKGTPELAHMKNWLDCARTRDVPNATVEDTYYAMAACYMANSSYQLKRQINWNQNWDI